MISALILLATQGAASGCDLAAVTTARAVHDMLGQRAAFIVASALANDPKVSAFVDRSAIVDLGAGDVGRPLGTGVDGIRVLAKVMSADQFQFLGWDYMDGPADACGKQSITVDFINTRDRQLSRVAFKFDQGRVVEAKGWQRSFKGGPLPALQRERKGS